MNKSTLIKQFKGKTPKAWKMAQRAIVAIGGASALLTMYPEHFAFLPESVTKTIMLCSLISAILIQFKSEDNGSQSSTNQDIRGN
jgi:hypothetical protein